LLIATAKTNAARLLDRLGIRYELRSCDVDPVDLAADPVDLAADPVDLAADPVDLAADPVDLAADPVDLAADPVDQKIGATNNAV
jgi:hypothetical protein